VLSGFGVLPRAAKLVGHYPIRRRGTFGGSVAHADPASEWCMVAQAFDAVVVAMSPRGRREIPVEDFFVGFFETELEPDELLVEVRLPRPRDGAAIEELARRPGDFAVVAAVVAFDAEPDGCARPRVVLGGVDATPVRVADAEAVLEGAAPSPELFAAAGEAAAAAIDPVADGHASAEDRRAIAGVLVRRALERAHATTKEARG